MERFTISLDDELARQFDALVASKGYATRSEAVRDLIRSQIGSETLTHGEGRKAATWCAATVSYVYDHHEQSVTSRLFDMKHAHHDLVVSSLHTHLDHDHGMETVVQQSITVNLGVLQGGQVPNLVPGEAHALIDIRYPPGFDGAQMRAMVRDALAPHAKVRWEVMPGSETEPAFTPPSQPLVQSFLRHARQLAEPDAVANVRVGLTDARLFRLAGMPAVVYGPTAFRMGGVDEHVVAEQVTKVFDVHLAVVADLMSSA